MTYIEKTPGLMAYPSSLMSLGIFVFSEERVRNGLIKLLCFAYT